jgi:hypothetical protein
MAAGWADDESSDASRRSFWNPKTPQILLLLLGNPRYPNIRRSNLPEVKLDPAHLHLFPLHRLRRRDGTNQQVPKAIDIRLEMGMNQRIRIHFLDDRRSGNVVASFELRHWFL